MAEKWTNVRITTALLEKIKDHVNKNEVFVSPSSFIDYALKKELRV
tara:strand:- start:492 stop:629 length:138 start_codon:yes stop_codon:yes gene_type:complete